MLSQAQFPPEICLSVWITYSRTRHLSATLIGEPDTSLEHLQQKQTPVWNTLWTHSSCGHPISVDPLPLPPPCNHPLPSAFLPFFKISHFFSIIEIRSLICKKHQTIKSKMHKMASFSKKKYLPVSKLSTLSILLLLLKLNLVNLYKTVNQKYYTCA